MDKTSNALDLKFRDMPEGVRNRWLAWANRHDWGGDSKPRFVKHEILGVAMETSCDGGGDDAIEIAYHTTPRQLRDWAGY